MLSVSRRVSGYCFALSAIVLAVLLKLVLEPFIGTDSPFVLLLGGVMLSAWWGGLGPGLFSSVLSALAAGCFFLAPYYSFSINTNTLGKHLQLGLFLMEASLISWLTDSLSRAHHRAADLSNAQQQVLGQERLALAAAGKAEERYRNLVNSLEAIVWEADPTTFCFSFVSQRAEAILGHPIHNWYSQPDFWVNLIHPDDREHTVQRCRQATAEGRDHDLEYRALAADGRVVWFRDLVYLVRDAGQVRHLRGLMVDITDRKSAELALRESEARFRQVADAMPQIVWTARPNGHVDYRNQRWYEFTGLPETIGGSNGWESLLHPEDVQRCHERWHAAVESGEPYEIEYRLKDPKRGNYRWHLGRALPVRDEEGEIVRWFGTSTDIDDQKRTEEALKELDRRKDEFLAVLSHELRNPLGPIRNALHIMRMTAERDPDLAEAREVIDRQVQQLAGIVDDLLDVFRIIHRKIGLRKEPLDLAHLVRVTFEDYRSSLEDAGRTVALQLPDEPVWVQGDPTRLAQILTNLLNNAVKFTNPHDQVTVRVTMDVEEQRARVSVRDTGIGITPQLLPHVFETFAQGERSIDRSRGGLGLGLALVKGLIEFHGGSVHASSAGIGRGSELSFWIPLSKKPKPIGKVFAPVTPSTRYLRILIVEDNRDAAMTLSTLLQRYGHEVTVAHSGPAGVERAKEWRPEVVLCDLGLPEMDGYEVASALRQDSATASARLIAVSGYGQEDDRLRSEQAGFDLHLTKPVDPVELQRLLTVLKVGA